MPSTHCVARIVVGPVVVYPLTCTWSDSLVVHWITCVSGYMCFGVLVLVLSLTSLILRSCCCGSTFRAAGYKVLGSLSVGSSIVEGSLSAADFLAVNALVVVLLDLVVNTLRVTNVCA